MQKRTPYQPEESNFNPEPICEESLDIVAPINRETGKRDNAIGAEPFLGKIRSIIATAGACKIDSAHAMLLINRTYGYTWSTIPWGRFDDLNRWMAARQEDWRHVLNPEWPTPEEERWLIEQYGEEFLKTHDYRKYLPRLAGSAS